VSIHADDEYSLKFAVESELDDVVPGDGLAGLVIARYHKTRRRRIAGAVGLLVIFAGIGVPIGVTAAGGGGAKSAVLRVATFTLKLPQQYQVAAAAAPACTAPASAVTGGAAAAVVPRPRVSADDTAAATAPAGCILMLLTPAGAEPPGARPVTVGHYHAWLVPAGNAAALVIGEATPGQDLVISESRLSEPQFLRLIATGLS
jgi:hypothetical protein